MRVVVFRVALWCALGVASVAEAADWATWLAASRAQAASDLPEAMARLQGDLAPTLAATDPEHWAMAAGYRLGLLSELRDPDAVKLSEEVSAALQHRPGRSPGRLALLLGLARFQLLMRDQSGAQASLQEAQTLADELGDSHALAETEVVRALHLAYEGDASSAQGLVQQALSRTQDPWLRHEAFLGPELIARLWSASTPALAAPLLTEIDQQIASLNSQGQRHLALQYGIRKVIVLRRSGQLDRARDTLKSLVDGDAAMAQQFRGLKLFEAGLQQELKNWKDCVALSQQTLDGPNLLVVRVEALMQRAVCSAAMQSPGARGDIAAIDEVLPLYKSSPAMRESMLSHQARAYESLGDIPAAFAKLKAARAATFERVARANEFQRQRLQTAYEVAAKDRENLALKAREQLASQRRQVLVAALALTLIVMAVLAEMFRRQVSQRRRLEELTGQLRELNASRTRLVAAACHDLRQPAHALGMLAENMVNRAKPEDRQALEALRQSSSSLSDMLDGLFDMSRLESDRYTPNLGPVMLGSLFDELRAQFTVVARSKGLALDIAPVDGCVLSDQYLLRRMLMNLLSNAIKYTVSGGVQISARRQDDEWWVDVKDSGPGIPVEQQQTVFSEYVRLDNSRGTDGLGIGLALVKRSAALLAHGLTLASRPGEGSCFTLRLQAMEPSHPDGLAPTMPARVTGVIGIVDDDQHILDAMQSLLSDRGHVVCAAQSLEGLQASLAALGAPRPAVLLSDLHLGSQDVLETLASMVGEQGPWSGAKAVLITGDLSPDILARCEVLGVQVAYKPVPAKRLVDLVERLLAGPGRGPNRARAASDA